MMIHILSVFISVAFICRLFYRLSIFTTQALLSWFIISLIGQSAITKMCIYLTAIFVVKRLSNYVVEPDSKLQRACKCL